MKLCIWSRPWIPCRATTVDPSLLMQYSQAIMTSAIDVITLSMQWVYLMRKFQWTNFYQVLDVCEGTDDSSMGSDTADTASSLDSLATAVGGTVTLRLVDSSQQPEDFDRNVTALLSEIQLSARGNFISY
ncbi:hypothetical protein RvY_16098-3 [Ramazzottius varieornatus]|uniref:Uncharacterized protein n=1 Tax=Ramazzottius varieornatus TaxID=947166 RepID=A0A1D1VX91_RAMVA|nr:hypothetical protein RvY_16098-3 [Ramazzottius varieornatus]